MKSQSFVGIDIGGHFHVSAPSFCENYISTNASLSGEGGRLMEYPLLNLSALHFPSIKKLTINTETVLNSQTC